MQSATPCKFVVLVCAHIAADAAAAAAAAVVKLVYFVPLGLQCSKSSDQGILKLVCIRCLSPVSPSTKAPSIVWIYGKYPAGLDSHEDITTASSLK